MQWRHARGSGMAFIMPAKNKQFIYKLFQYKIMLLMLLPGIAYVIIFNYIPMAGAVIAFKNYTYSGGLFFSPWVGFDNFRFFFISGRAWPLTRNTFLYNIAFIVTNMFFEVIFAIILSEIRLRKYKRVTQSSMFFPFFISWVVVASIMYNIFNYEYGVLNSILKWFGATPLNIYDNPLIWPFLLVALRAWKSVGYGAVIYLAAITGLDQQMYEAADIDGANIWHRIRYITLPSLIPTMVIMFLFAMGGVFRGDFGMFYQLVGSNGKLFPIADIIDTFVFRALIQNPNIGMSAASGLYQSLLCFITVMLVNKIIKTVQPDYTLF